MNHFDVSLCEQHKSHDRQVSHILCADGSSCDATDPKLIAALCRWVLQERAKRERLRAERQSV